MNVSRGALSTFILSKFFFFLNDEQYKKKLQELGLLVMKNQLHYNLWIVVGSSI
jgi:hypothetical protein